jgi:hypothetical protein
MKMTEPLFRSQNLEFHTKERRMVGDQDKFGNLEIFHFYPQKLFFSENFW